MPLNDGAVNQILPFAPDGLESSGDLIALGEYADDDMRKRGHQAGLARRGLQNRAQRQAAHVAAGVAQFVANRHAAGVRDDGDLDAVEEGLRDAVREEAEVVRDDSCRGFTSEGQHVAYEGDIAAIARNSLYAVRKGTATGLPADMPAEAWAFVHTMVMPGDAARTQLLWSVDDPDHPGWWRRRAAGAWGGWKGVGSGSGFPIGMTFWWPGTTPPAGSLAINDGPLLPREAYPQLWAMAQASGNIITEAAWQAQAAVQSSVGAFSSGDGATTFRCPRLRDYVRGANPSGGRAVGAWQDASSITGAVLYEGGSPGAGLRLNLGSLDGQQQVQSSTANSSSPTTQLSVTTGRMRPPSVSWLPCIKAFDTVTNAGEVDIAALAATLAGKVDRSDWVELVPGRAWKMPNGLIIQVGKTAPLSSGTASANSRTESFPLAFPIGCYSLILGTVSEDTINPNAFAALIGFTASQFTWTADIVVTGSPAANLAASWIAIGH